MYMCQGLCTFPFPFCPGSFVLKFQKSDVKGDQLIMYPSTSRNLSLHVLLELIFLSVLQGR